MTQPQNHPSKPNYLVQPQQPLTQAQPMVAPPVPPRKPSLLASRWAFGAYGLIAGAVLASVSFVGGGAVTAQPGPAPAPTVTVTAPAPAAPRPTTSATSEPTTAGYTPDKSDWRVGVKVKSQQCFGSAGCSVTVTIDPQYVGVDPLPDSGTIEVTYAISGDTSGPVIGSFTVEGSQVSYDKETDLDTKSSHTKIAAKVTDVSYSE